MRLKLKFCLIVLFFASLSAHASEFDKFNTDNIKFGESSIPYLVKHPNLAAMNTYNTELKQVMSRLRCVVPQKLKDKTFWEIYTGVGFVNEELISIKIRSNYNCDNLKTVTSEDSSLTFDFTTRRSVRLSDLFFKKPNSMKTIRKSLYKELTKEECRNKLNFYIESENLFKDYLSYYLSKEGITLQMKLPYGLKACIKDAFISYSEILKSTSYTSTLKSTKKLDD